MSNIIQFNNIKNKETTWYNGETICILCAKRCISTYESGTALKDLICDGCGKHGGIILTGQVYTEKGEPI